MVGKVYRLSMLLPAIALALLLPLCASPAAAQEIGEEEPFTLREEYRVEINEVGDGHITDVITYDPAWFAEAGPIFEENPNLLSRRYRSDTNVGEVENFDVDIDSGGATITVTFDTPGLAYNLADGWTVLGYRNYQLKDESDDEVVFTASWTITNEFSLFETLPLEETAIIDLPDGAQNASYDRETGAIEYELPYAAEGKGVLAENKTAFTLVFALVMALSLLLLVFVSTRKAAGQVTGAGIPGAPPAAVVPPAGEATEPGRVEAPPPLPGAPPGAESAAVSKFCKACGHPRGSPEERFCRACGAPHA